MTEIIRATDERSPVRIKSASAAELQEMVALGIVNAEGEVLPCEQVLVSSRSVSRSAISAPRVLNEAFDYARPSSFSRGLRIDLGSHALLLISGTASVDEEGRTIHPGDFRAQSWRTYRNITELLSSEGATWTDVVRTTCYLRDIERDYRDFNEVRTSFFQWLGLNPLPASTGIQARLCREDLLVEIEAIAIIKNGRS